MLYHSNSDNQKVDSSQKSIQTSTTSSKKNPHSTVNNTPFLTQANIIQLQKAIGNQAVIKMLTSQMQESAPPIQMQSNSQQVAQLVQKDIAITGITHLVKMRDGSIFDGDEGTEVEDGDHLQIDTDVKYNSRRGPNQEMYQEEDRTGPSIYKWFQVLSVNRFKAGKDVYVREDTFREVTKEDKTEIEPWVIFGMDGKDDRQIESALELGYRRFDCAESYGATTSLLAKAIQKKVVKRKDYEIIYKFNVGRGESESALKRRLGAIQQMFAGKLDSVIIHNLDGTQEEIASAWRVLNQLKNAGAVSQIGLGNVSATQHALLEDLQQVGAVDVIENSVASVLGDKDTQELIKKTGARVYYYDVIKTAREMDVNSEEGIKALIYMMTSVHNKSGMILSSDKSKRQQENLEQFGKGPHAADFDGDEQYTELGKIDTWQRSENSCQETDSAFVLPGNVQDWLRSLLEAGATESMRTQITTADHHPTIRQWIVSNTAVTDSDLNGITVPTRTGLKKRYLGMKLGEILDYLFGSKNCDWKWSIQLVSLLVATGDDWDQAVKFGSDEIVEGL